MIHSESVWSENYLKHLKEVQMFQEVSFGGYNLTADSFNDPGNDRPKAQYKQPKVHTIPHDKIYRAIFFFPNTPDLGFRALDLATFETVSFPLKLGIFGHLSLFISSGCE